MIVVECAGCGGPVEVGDEAAGTYTCRACGTSAPLPPTAAGAVHASHAYRKRLGRTAQELATSLVLADVSSGIRLTVFFIGGAMAATYVIGFVAMSLKDGELYWVALAGPVIGAALAMMTPWAIMRAVRRLEVWARSRFALPAIVGPEGMTCAHCGGSLPEQPERLAAIRCRHCRAPNVLPREAVAALTDQLDAAGHHAAARKRKTEKAWVGLELSMLITIFLIPAISGSGCMLMTLEGDVLDRALAPVLYDEPDVEPRRYVLLGNPDACWVYEVDAEGRVRGMSTDGEWSTNRLETDEGLIRAEDLVGEEGTGTRVVRVYGAPDGNRAVLARSGGTVSREALHELGLKRTSLPIDSSFRPERRKKESRAGQ